MAKQTVDPKRSAAAKKGVETKRKNASLGNKTTKETTNTRVEERTLSPLVWLLLGLILLGLAWIIFGPCKVCAVVAPVAPLGGATEVAESTDVSCVKRMEPGDEAKVFTETWDSERRVWIHLYGGTCTGPYCFSYDSCDNPLETLEIQPFMTGHELSPVDGKPFDICYNFEGNCAR